MPIANKLLRATNLVIGLLGLSFALTACTSKSPASRARALVKEHDELRGRVAEHSRKLQHLLSTDGPLITYRDHSNSGGEWDTRTLSELYNSAMIPVYPDNRIEPILADFSFWLYAENVGWDEFNHRRRKMARYEIFMTRLEQREELDSDDVFMLWALDSSAISLIKWNGDDPSGNIDQIRLRLKEEVEELRKWQRLDPTARQVLRNDSTQSLSTKEISEIEMNELLK